MASSKYDLIIHRRDGGSVGYMCLWNEGSESPMKIVSKPPDLPLSTSTSLTQAGGDFTARDAAPPYPIEVNNWNGGAGQESYDHAAAIESAFWKSKNIDASEESEFELGPLVHVFDDSDILNIAGFALGTFWASFTPKTYGEANGNPMSVRYLLRVELTSSSADGWYLGTEEEVDLALSNLADVDYSLGDITDSFTVAAGDVLFSPETGEAVLVTDNDGGEITVTRGYGGTTATTHRKLETWIALRWQPVTLDAEHTEPAEKVTAIATDGEYVYAAFHDPGTDNGSVWRGKPNEDAWTEWSTDTNIVALHFCGGYMYGAQDRNAASARTTVGYFTSGGVFTPISLAGALTPRMNTAGLSSVGNYVYWGVTDGTKSSIYRIQHSSENLFELVSNLPDGFILSDVIGHLGSLYAGGYIDNLATTAHDSSSPRYEGALYIVGANNVVARLFRIKGPSDSRIKGLSSAGPHILCLANEDCYLYNVATGGYYHYAQVPSNTISGTTEAVEGGVYGDHGFTVTPEDGSYFFNARYAADGVVSCSNPAQPDNDLPEGQDWISYEASASANLTQDWDGNDEWIQWGCDAGKWARAVLSVGTEPADIIDLGSDVGMLEWTVSYLRSQAGAIVVGLGTKEIRVKMQGLVSGSTVTTHRFMLGYTDDPSCDIDEYKYIQAASIPAPATTKCRLVWDTNDVKLFINDIEGASVPYSQLRTAQYPNKIMWSVGWPGDSKTDSNRERIRWHSMTYTPAGAITPDYEGGELITTGMKSIASAQGASVIPVPGASWAYVSQKQQAKSGYLITSKSAFHMGSVSKYFVKVSVEHSTLLEGQSLVVTPIVDGEQMGNQSGEQGAVITHANIGKEGVEIQVRVDLSDTDPVRAYADRLKVKRITVRFYPANSPHSYVVTLNCRKDVKCRNGKEWDYDPESAIRFAYAAADNGEVVDVYNNFTDDGENETQEMRVESAELHMGPSDRSGYDGLVGTLRLELRRVP